MPSPEFEVGLARLLSERELRTAFRRDPAAFPGLAGIDPDDLDRQARMLIDKRRHEVARLLPRTFAALGPTAGRTFDEHAARFWPRGHRRALEDAVSFGRRLRGHSELCQSEWNRVRFELEGGRWSVRLVPDARVRGRERRALHLLWRDRRGAVQSAVLWFGLP